jgi:TIR domain/Pentapeptide repeats (8 copies)
VWPSKIIVSIPEASEGTRQWRTLNTSKFSSKGVKRWNRWRKECPGVTPQLDRADLSGENLAEANLVGADLRQANLSAADLQGADLGTADLRGADLIGSSLSEVNLVRANLSDADLRGASLVGANLREASLPRACLTEADLSGTILIGTDLSGANLWRTNLRGVDVTAGLAYATNFADVDLSNVQGLQTTEHDGPSTIGIDTIYKSGGKIPEVFLRGCGVPDEFIDFIRQMGVRAIEFYSCFISYSTLDQEFAQRLYNDLQGNKVRCWFAPHDVKGGRKLHEQIDEAIRLHDKLLLILSEHSMNSEWVKTEIAKARKREVKDAKRVLFPLRLVGFEALRDWECFDGDTGKDSAREIREYFIPDFSNWKDHDSYQEAFQRLVKDLKAVVSSQ